MSGQDPDRPGNQAQAEALDRVFGAAAAMIPREDQLAAIEVGGGTSGWAELAGRHGMKLTASADAPAPDAGLNLVLSAGALGDREPGDRIALVAGLWRALAPGGWLVVMEELVPSDDEALGSSDLGALDLEAAIVDGTGGGAILEHFEALRDPREDLYRTGLAVCSKASGTSDAVRVHGLQLSTASPSQQELGYGSRG